MGSRWEESEEGLLTGEKSDDRYSLTILQSDWTNSGPCPPSTLQRDETKCTAVQRR